MYYAMYKSGNKTSAFEEVYEKIAENESQRKIDERSVEQTLINFKKNINDHEFIVKGISTQTRSVKA